jgi:hypothetical protein
VPSKIDGALSTILALRRSQSAGHPSIACVKKIGFLSTTQKTARVPVIRSAPTPESSPHCLIILQGRREMIREGVARFGAVEGDQRNAVADFAQQLVGSVSISIRPSAISNTPAMIPPTSRPHAIF